ncbi:hypothetical protein ACIA8F_34955 [Streptomyces sp. NPDC051563]|uniref:hypothetical protein n=1 Tax=Streptomyces sp. NPDC051563 TaxID=3365659 RepID=UPI0037AF0258
MPWLVVVDGLDEVASPAVRRRLLEKLAEQVRLQPHAVYRLVITSRPLPQEELAPFTGLPGLGCATLRGFDADQQHVFAERWFAAQGEGGKGGRPVHDDAYVGGPGPCSGQAPACGDAEN